MENIMPFFFAVRARAPAWATMPNGRFGSSFNKIESHSILEYSMALVPVSRHKPQTLPCILTFRIGLVSLAYPPFVFGRLRACSQSRSSLGAIIASTKVVGPVVRAPFSLFCQTEGAPLWHQQSSLATRAGVRFLKF